MASARNAACAGQLWAVELGYTRAAAIHVDDAYGQAYIQALKRHCEEAGLPDVAAFPFADGDDQSIIEQVRELAALPDAARRWKLTTTPP